MILYLTSNANVNLLDFVESELELPVKKLTGQFSLLSFVVKDMRHFGHIRYFAIDRTAVLESDEEMAQALLSFQTMYDMRVIIIVEGLPESSPFLHQLVNSGITDLITALKIETIQEEIRESLSSGGMQRFKRIVPPIVPESILRPGEPEQYQFSCTNIRIALAGSDRRSGVTTTAFNLVCWLNNHGASACYVETNTSRHLAQIIHLFQPEQSGNAYVMEGCDFYFTRELNRDYNFIVMDCGVLGEKRLQADFVNADVRILCGSAMPYELPVFFRAMQRCSPLTVQALGMFVPEDMKPLLKKVSTENITFAESSHELFDTEVNSPFCKQLIANYL